MSEIVAVPQQVTRTCSLLNFRNRFTQLEKVAIYTLAKTNVEVQVWLDDLASVGGQEVNLDDPYLLASLNALVALSVLAAGRPAQIIA